MDGKRGLVMGVANDHSIAWGIAQQLHAAGAELGVTYLPDEKNTSHVRALAFRVGTGGDTLEKAGGVHWHTAARLWYQSADEERQTIARLKVETSEGTEEWVNNEVPANVQHLRGINLATALSVNSVSVETVEHLLAALVSMRIDNVLIELNSPEVPIMDGSSAPFIFLIQEAGVKVQAAARQYLKILRPISLARGDKHIALYPSDEFRVTYSISYDHPLLRHQARTTAISESIFVEEIAPARTFGMMEDKEN